MPLLICIIAHFKFYCYNYIMRSKILIPKNELNRLYYKEKKSKYKIGKIYNCSFQTVLNRMREFGMKPLSRSIIQSKYEKNNFSGDKTEKAYLLGFRLGDLNVYKTTNNSEVIVARCHTTRKEQIELIRLLFKKYGKVSYKLNKADNSYYINCFLNDSFIFLLPNIDKIENWISRNKKYSFSFAAGYIDAEANIGVYDGRARFKVDSYDKNIIYWLYGLFIKNKIICPKPIKIGKKNKIYDKKLGYKYNNNLWRIRVSNVKSLERLFNNIAPFLKHKKRVSDFNKCLKNLDDRRNK